MALQIAIGLFLATAISVGANAAGALTHRAALASTALGTLVFSAGGVAWSLPFITFFISSALLSDRARQHGMQSGRTARQVLANGSVPGLWAACFLVHGDNRWTVLYLSATATAAADTWATEIGRRSSGSPRHVLTGRRVRAGTSGGITRLGLLASVAGPALVLLPCLPTGLISIDHVPDVVIAGFLGALADSVLGGTVQERRWCPHCLEATEEARHARCSTRTEYLSGLRGFDNDWVNLTAGLCGSLFGLAFTHVL